MRAPFGGDVRSLAIDPSTPATLYAGRLNGGVFKSTDGGATWSASNTGLTNFNVPSLAIDPLTPATLYAGTQGNGVFDITQTVLPQLPHEFLFLAEESWSRRSTS
jgi:hypothetical protein